MDMTGAWITAGKTDDSEFRAMAPRTVGEGLDVALRRQRDDLEKMRRPADEVERAGADGAGGAQNADALCGG